jgi:hypothetical protein
MAKQMRVSPSEGEQELITAIATAWKRSEGDVILDGFRRGLNLLLEDYERLIYHRSQASADNDSALRQALVRMAAGESIDPIDLVTLAHDIDIDVETLERIRQCFNGERHDHTVHTGT